MTNIPTAPRVVIYVLVGATALMFMALWYWQLGILRGKRFENPDGSADDWHDQKTHYGIAFADLSVSAPVAVVGAVLAFLGSKWGFYLVALVSFFSVWANTMTTSTSLRFENPRIGIAWFLAFPFGALMSLAYLILTFVYFADLYAA